ncbi:MAG: TatD family hydrolase [Candidatus Pacebacteria bacterium]|nr:TatD family hydrolase [Candidatus Paceibacterota bacterium]
MIFDSHTHLNLAAFDKDRREVIKKLKPEGIWVINVGTCLETSQKAITIAKDNKNCWATVGLHPSHLIPAKKDENEISEKNLADSNSVFLKPEIFDERFEALLEESKVVAVGECGLDYSYLNNFSSEEREEYERVEEEEFRKQVQAAKRYHLPLCLHIRDLYEDALGILDEESYEDKAVFHFFTGNKIQAEQIIKKGFYISFSGVITYSQKMDEVVEKAPLGKILIETDAPYVAPEPYRGKRNEPIYVKEVAKKIAEIKKLPLKDIEEATFQNARRLFNI